MRLVDDNILDELFRTAVNSERLRAHYLLHASHQEKVQRLLSGSHAGFPRRKKQSLPHSMKQLPRLYPAAGFFLRRIMI